MADSRRSVVRWVWCGAHCGSPRRPPRPFRESRPSSVRVLRVLVRSVPRASPTSSTTRRRPIDDGSSSNEGKPRRSGRSRPARTHDRRPVESRGAGDSISGRGPGRLPVRDDDRRLVSSGNESAGEATSSRQNTYAREIGDCNRSGGERERVNNEIQEPRWPPRARYPRTASPAPCRGDTHEDVSFCGRVARRGGRRGEDPVHLSASGARRRLIRHRRTGEKQRNSLAVLYIDARGAFFSSRRALSPGRSLCGSRRRSRRACLDGRACRLLPLVYARRFRPDRFIRAGESRR